MKLPPKKQIDDFFGITHEDIELDYNKKIFIRTDRFHYTSQGDVIGEVKGEEEKVERGWDGIRPFQRKLQFKGIQECNDKDIDEIFEFVDLNKDGNLDYAEFIDMWKYQ